VVAAMAVVVMAACSSGGGSGGSGSAVTCPAGYDGGTAGGGTESESFSGACGNLLTGTVGNGGSCQTDSDCAPTCCACPEDSRSSQVVLCRQGACVVGPEVCCIWIAENQGFDGGGYPFVCTK
jgi:hypothetical protein